MKSSVPWKKTKRLIPIPLDDIKDNKKSGKDHPVMIPVGFNIFGLKILAVVTAILLNPLICFCRLSNRFPAKRIPFGSGSYKRRPEHTIPLRKTKPGIMIEF